MAVVSDDDELARRMVLGNPTRTPRDARPDAAALLMRDRITRAAPTAQARALPGVRAATRVMWSAAAAMVVIAVAAVSFLVPRTSAMAVTPVPIAFTGGGTVAEMAATATGALARWAEPDAPIRLARSESWGLSVEPEAQRSEIVPQVMTLEWNEDLSGQMTVVAGKPYLPDGVTGDGANPSANPGDVLTEMVFDAGEFGTPVVSPPGDSRENVVALLTAFGLPESPIASDVVQAMTGVFEQWTLTNKQHAQLLSILVDTGGLTVLGSGTDRAGRPVVGVEMKSIFPGVKDVVLISAETGRIVGVESARVTPDGIVPAGAVISYRLWETA